MGTATTLLEGLCGHALALGAQSIQVEHKNRQEYVFALKGGVRIKIANYASTRPDGKELLGNLYAAAKKPVRTLMGGRIHIVTVRAFQSSGSETGKGAFEVSISLAPKRDPSVPPAFTEKQGQYLAYIQYYTEIHRQAPAEADLQRYFEVSPPSIHEMIKTLERNGLIEKTPREARSIRLLVHAHYLPQLQRTNRIPYPARMK